MDGTSPAARGTGGGATASGTVAGGRDRRPWNRFAGLLLLFAAGTTLGVAGRRGPAWLQDAAAVVIGLVVLVAVVLAVRWLVRRRRARRASPGERPPPPPAVGSPTWSEQQRRWAVVAVPFYGFYLGFAVSAFAWWLPFAIGLAALLLGLVGRLLLRSSRRRRWASARAAHPDEAVALVAVTDVSGMRLAQWAKAARATVPSVSSGEARLVAGADGVSLWRPTRPERLVHRWAWEDVELSRRSSDAEMPHLVLTLLGPVPAARVRAVPASRRRFDLTLNVLTPGVRDHAAEAVTATAHLDLSLSLLTSELMDHSAADAATSAALEELLAARPDQAVLPDGDRADASAGTGSNLGRPGGRDDGVPVA